MTSPNTPRLETFVRSVLAPCLREEGFQGSGRSYRRLGDGWIRAVGVQAWRSGGSFTIEIGVHPIALPDVIDRPVDPKRVTVYDCIFRRRLAPLGREDMWWDHDGSERGLTAAVTKAKELYVLVGRPQLERMTRADSVFRTVTPNAFARGASDFEGFDPPKIRTAFLLARLRAAEGRWSEAVKFARWALERCGADFSYRGELEALVASHGGAP